MLLYEINLTFYPKIQKNKKNKKVLRIELDAPPPALNVETSNSFKPFSEPVNTLYKSPVIPKKIPWHNAPARSKKSSCC